MKKKSTKKKTEKKKLGRPIKYSEADMQKLCNLAVHGLTDKDCCDLLGIDNQTLANYKKRYPTFFDSLKKNKLVADEKAIASLFQRARGYSHPDIHISNYQGEITKTPIIKHYPPDPVSLIFWLKNRLPQLFRDTKDINLPLDAKGAAALKKASEEVEKALSAIKSSRKEKKIYKFGS